LSDVRLRRDLGVPQAIGEGRQSTRPALRARKVSKRARPAEQTITAWQPVMSSNAAFEPGKPIRGGIPVIFPWFGRDPRRVGGGAQHGFELTASSEVEPPYCLGISPFAIMR
jgi:hypothetical protein